MKATFQDLGNGVTVVDAEYTQPGIAALYLIEEDGDVAIVETGTNDSIPYILEVLESKQLSFDDVKYIIPTHVHLDHAGGAGELMLKCPNAKLVIHPYGAAHMIDPSRLIAGASAVYGEEAFKKLYGTIQPVDEDRVIEAPDLFTIDMKGRVLEFLDTPGHANHHFSIYDKKSDGIFTGDTFGLSYPQLTTKEGRFIFCTTTPVQFNPEALLASIDKILAKNTSKIYLTHFSEIKPTEKVIEQLKASVNAFVEISEAAKDMTENRIEHIDQKIREYLLKVLADMGCEQDVDFQNSVIKFDSLLNAQGLDFWLSKLARKKA
ncbi:MBL fold metallo-hydrolase [Cocleimonas sp. KMM 6892]|uniref:MBL fold metallo-hydrolase n=1 Tax=unclassified Cocleimonas TaxID=2639732 RepID=UPI002DB5ADB0|nr:MULTISPECIES: MBL fold metallo-hydrolase [unclassified Cocleimonas]MEB8434270.1 MBL fold metallo-hydrolase [Cocleimonas sp. KMM 6892]MEC4717111.1 MBL fold metallo-hydrolase [Cocleimonas sp. KMM 6895]MEC4746542.1 MBL fold metallo-hydrolase [Cocleimonas sp. KMM 6896]